MLLFTEQQGPSLPRNLKHSGSLAASHHGLHDCLYTCSTWVDFSMAQAVETYGIHGTRPLKREDLLIKMEMFDSSGLPGAACNNC